MAKTAKIPPNITVLVWFYKAYLKAFKKLGATPGPAARKAFALFFNLAVLYGAYKIFKMVQAFAGCLGRRFLTPRVQTKDRLYKKYGKETERTWAVVTGGSDGIGLEMAKNLGKQGFNVCIISRNEKKMQEKLIEIKSSVKHSKFEANYIVADFSQLTTIESLRYIADELKDKDVGMVVLNAGCGPLGPFAEIKEEEVEMTVSTNVLHVVYLTKLLLPQLKERWTQAKKKSGLIIVSSGLGTLPVPGALTYSATKTFGTFLGEGLNFELKNQGVDVMSYQPGEVATKLLGRFKTDIQTCSTERAVEASFRDMGRLPMSQGAFRHEMSIGVLNTFQGDLVNGTFSIVGHREMRTRFAKEAGKPLPKTKQENFLVTGIGYLFGVTD